MVMFQWVPFRVGLERNETADKPAKKGTTLHGKETPLRADTLKKLLNHKIVTKYEQEADELAATKRWERYPQNLGRIQRQTSEGSGSKFQTQDRTNCLAAHLRKIRIYECSECTIC
jgi:hypothetical protein